MKYLIVFVLMIFSAVSAQAEHNGGADDSTGENASCNASFNRNCPEEQTHTADSSGFAAPAGALGSSPSEIAVISLLVAACVGGQVRRSSTRRAQNQRPKQQ